MLTFWPKLLLLFLNNKRQGSRLRPFFESVRVKIWRGHTCASAWSALLQEKDFTDHVKARASVEPGLRPFHTARVSRAEAAQKRHVCRAGAARAHCAFTLKAEIRLGAHAKYDVIAVRWCAQRTEHNGGFGFQTKMKDRFLNQRRWTCWYSCRKNMQVLSATDSLVLLFFLFWKACYLCCLPQVTLWRLSLFF